MFDNSISASMMEKSASALWHRAQVVNNNIANEATPGYKAKRTEFESLLRRELNNRTNMTAFSNGEISSRIRAVEPTVYEDKTTVGRADGNNVDIDSENIELARIQIQMDALSQKLSGHYSLMKYAITGGR